MSNSFLKFEWKILRADATVWVMSAIFFLSAAYATFNGARWVRFQEEAIAAARADDAARVQSATKLAAELEAGTARVPSFRDPRNANAAARYILPQHAVKPPAPLAPLATGQSDLYPYFFKVSMDAREEVTTSSEIENPLRLLAGRFDLAFVIVYLWPLLIIVLGYNFVSGEREGGRLSLLLSQPMQFKKLAGAKLGVRVAFLAGLVVVLVAALLLSGVVGWDAGAPARLALLTAVILAYTAFWCGLVVVVSSAGWNSATNALALSALWLVFVIVLPAALNLSLKAVYPLPSRVEFISAMREASDEVSARGNPMLAQYYEDHPELAPDSGEIDLGNFAARRIVVQQEIEEKVQPVLDRFNLQLEKQQRAVDRLKFLSPAILTQFAFNDLSGTGVGRHRHFLSAVEDYHEQWRNHFGALILRREMFRDFDALPKFQYAEQPAREVLRRAGFDFFGLALPAGLIAWIGIRRLERYPLIE